MQEEDPDTSTASDDSGNGPWTVVTSPTHKRTASTEASSRPSPVPEEPASAEATPRKVGSRVTCVLSCPVCVKCVDGNIGCVSQ